MGDYPTDERTTEDDIRHKTPIADKGWIIAHEVDRLDRAMGRIGISMTTEIENSEVKISILLKGV